MSKHHHGGAHVDSKDVSLPEGHWIGKASPAAFIVGLIVLALATMVGPHESFFPAYLVSFLYFLSLALGALFFVILQFSTRAGWSVVARRYAENYLVTFPVLALLFLGVLFGMDHLFHHWMHPEANDTVLLAKRAYLNVPFFLVRAVIYFGIWNFATYFYRKYSTAQDTTGGDAITRKLQRASYPFLVLFVLSLTFASFDWIMSLQPHFASTIFGVYYFAGCAVSIYALLIVTIALTRGTGHLARIISTEHMHDLGKLMFGHVCFWTYIAFGQFFLIWYANLPEETSWYEMRAHEWLPTSIFLIAGHFVIPFLFLMPRTVKRSPVPLIIGAVWVLAVHFLDIYWLVMPNFVKDGFQLSIAQILCLVGMGGMFFGTVGFVMRKNPLIPIKDPRLAESLSFENQ